MDVDIVKAWIADQHIILHGCRDPATCKLPLDYEQQSTTDTAPMDGQQLRRSPRKPRSTRDQSEREFQSDPEPQTEPESPDDVFGEDTQKTPRQPGRRLAIRPAPDLGYPYRSLGPQEYAPRSTQTRSYTETLSDNQKQTFTSGSRTGSSATSRTRSTSPMKKPDDLQKLEKPVEWISAEFGGLKDIVDRTGSAVALKLIQDIRKIAKSRGYLPRELRDVLEDELEADDVEFASENRHVNMTDAQAKDIKTIFNSNDQNTNHLMALHNELMSIRLTVTTTRDFSNRHRSEATWNDHVHGPTLRLAVSHIPQVEAENITTSGIEKTCIPPARGNLESLGGKMIDYALLLRPTGELKLRIADFIDALPDVRSFNQSTHGPLCAEPTGVLIETKVDTKRQGEGKTQLGLWLAAWFGRVAKFQASKKLPFLPVILVVCHQWELHFAFDMGDRYEVHGGMDIGSTKNVGQMYQLLAVLRLLGGWVNGEFRDWVEDCVTR